MASTKSQKYYLVKKENMERRTFLQSGLALPFFPMPYQQRTFVESENLVIEKSQPGKPHAGKVLAAIQPHSDDIPIFAAGTVAKLIAEGYTGYLIQMTNDDHAGAGATVGEVIMNNEKDTQGVAKALGLRKVYNLYYRNHRLDNVSPVEIRSRLIFLIRMLKIDTIVCYDPSGHYEENPDHYVTAKAWEAARWMSGGDWITRSILMPAFSRIRYRKCTISHEVRNWSIASWTSAII